jgi:hypothetical protein
MKSHVTDRTEMMELIQKAFVEYPTDKLDGIWGCLFNCYREILNSNGNNIYKIPHNGGRKRQKNEGTSVDLKVPTAEYRRVRDLLAR